MQIMTINTNDLLKKIEQAFPLIEMPSFNEIQYHKENCPECEYTATDLEYFRGKEINGEVIRVIHQELSCLSAKSWQWILPYYLRYSLTLEAQYNTFEITFLIFNLGPLSEFENDTINRLSLINNDQIRVLKDFMLYLSSMEYWKNYCPDELTRGIEFLIKLLDKRILMLSCPTSK